MSLSHALQPDLGDAAAFTAARCLCRRHGRSFYFASFFLPIEKRNAAYTVYAFCRLLDDAVDTAADRAQAERRLAALAQRLEEVYVGQLPAGESPEDLAMRAFQRIVRQYAIPRHHFTDLLDGCRMDLAVTRYETWADLQRYCYHVAGVVGLILCRVLGLRHAAAREHAVQMGTAMQLTNILRDVKEDYARGRVYLPQEDLRRFGLSDEDIARGAAGARFRQLMRFEIERARSLYRHGAQGLCHLPADGSRFTASAMAVLYAGILREIERQNYDVFAARAGLSALGKCLRLRAAWKLSRREVDQPLPGVF